MINVGIVGLGRLGKEYAKYLAHDINTARLVAACSISEKELVFAKNELGVPFLFKDYEEMLKQADIEAIFVISSTDQHAAHIIMALQHGKHVFSEKPLAVSIEACQKVARISESHPELICQVGFVRRYDPSYQDAKIKVGEGLIGKPFLVKSQTVDKDFESGFQIQYVGKSGGIFHDYNIHDIDLVRWFLESEIKSVYAIGGAFKYPEFAEAGDADNVMTIIKLENESMAVIGASRTAMHGHDTYTEIVGTEGSLRIGRPSSKNRVEIYDKHGARQECVATFWERFEDAFLIMAKDFIACIEENIKPETTIADAVKATQAAIACTLSFKEEREIKL